MAPPSASETIAVVDSGAASLHTNNKEDDSAVVRSTTALESDFAKKLPSSQGAVPMAWAAKKFADKYQEREYLKGRLTLAFRIFGKLGFDEGVAGHITLRVS